MESHVAIARLFALASAFGHGWAQPRVPQAVLQEVAEVLAVRGVYAFDSPHPLLEWEAAREFERLLGDVCTPVWRGEAPKATPRTEGDCGALYVLHIANCEEPRYVGLGPLWSHTTGRRRIYWDICPDTGRVVIEIRRPGDVVVLRAVVDPRGALTWRAPGAYYVRHVEALGEVLKALGVQLPVEVWLGISDEVETLRAQAAELQSDVLRARKMDNGPYEGALQLGLARNRAFRLLAGDPEFFPAVPMGTRITAAEAAARARQLRLEAARSLAA